MRQGRRVGLVIPALDEAASIGLVVRSVPPWVDRVVVADNGSSDGTAEVAAAAGAQVVREPRRGYGRACLAGLDAVRDCDVVVFADADASDDLAEMDRVVAPILTGNAALVIGSRVRGRAEKGALTPQQRFGNALACLLIRLRWRVRFTDLGPFRAITREALDRLAMADPDYGWTVEMQVKAARSTLAVVEVPVSYHRRIGRSKISGTVRGVLAAGAKILWVIAKSAVQPSRSAPAPGASTSPKNSPRIARSSAAPLDFFAELPGAHIVLGPLHGERLQGVGSRDAHAAGETLSPRPSRTSSESLPPQCDRVTKLNHAGL